MAITRQVGTRTVGGLIFLGALVAVPNLSPLRAEAPDVEVFRDGRREVDGACRSDGDEQAAHTDLSPASETGPIVGADALAVTVRVPRTAVIEVDDRGQVVAAWTNTGCAPSAGDDLWFQHPDGTITSAGADRSVVATVDWVGDFSDAGVFVDQRHGRG